MNTAKSILVILTFFLLFIFILTIIQKLCDRYEYIQSDIDGKGYYIRDQGDKNDKVKAANHLATISKRVDMLVDYMLTNQLPDKEISERLAVRWRRCELKETSINESSAAYTINKGDEMRLCVRNDNRVENLNTSMFVVLHELGHMMSVTYGHNDEFKRNFSYIVHLASALGIYRPEDFQNAPVNYCGTVINTTPCMSGTCEYTSIPVVGVEAFTI